MGDYFISSYKGHTLAGFLLSLLFFTNPILILLSMVGASFPDFDHDFRRSRVIGLIIFSLVLSGILYFLKLPFYIGLLLAFLGCIFLFSSHRGFTHSLIGGFVLSLLISFILVYGSSLLNSVFLFFNIDFRFSLLVLIFLFSIFILNKHILPLFFVGLVFSAFLVSDCNISFLYIFYSLFVGFLSHIILDSFSASGVSVFYPLYKEKFHKNFGIILLGVLVLFSISHLLVLFNYFKMFILV